MTEKTKKELFEIYNQLKTIEKRLETIATEAPDEAETLSAVAYDIEGARGDLWELWEII